MGNQTLGNVTIRKGAFFREQLIITPFILAIIPGSEVIRKAKLGYKLGNRKGRALLDIICKR